LASAFASAAEGIHRAFPFEQAYCVQDKKSQKDINLQI